MSKTRVSWTECVLAGVVLFGLVGTGGVLLSLVGLVYLVRSEVVALAEFDPTVVACAATAATLAGVAAWRLIVATKDSSPSRGAWAGFAVGVVAHPMCWSLSLLFQMAREPTLQAQSPYDVIFNLGFMTLLMTFSSLGLVGWISAPLGATLGYMAKRIKRNHALSVSKTQAIEDQASIIS